MDPIRAHTVAELLERSHATVIDERGATRTMAEIVDAGRRLAARFSSMGVGSGDRIAVQMPNVALYVDLLAAAALGGFVITAVNLRFADQLAASIIERTGARVVVRDADDLPPGALTRVEDDGRHRDLGPGDRFAIFTTSGTTSAPKLVVHQHQSIARHAGDVAGRFGYGPASVVMVAVPLCGVFGFSMFWAGVAGNSEIVIPSTFDPIDCARLIEDRGVTSLHGSDDMFHRLLTTDRDLSSIEVAGYARFNSALDGIVERCESRGVPLSGLYGMSEVQALYAWRGADEPPLERRWRGGGKLVSPEARCRVVDDELQLTGPSLFEGYLADGGDEIDTELTTRHFDGDWFRTGDLARIDGDNSFEYVARMGDVMRLGGFLVAPVEIESVLMELDQIDQAQVVAAAHERGARPVAFVIPSAGSDVDEQLAIEHCGRSLARFKCPVRVVPIEEFPVTDGPNGIKIQRGRLRTMAEDLLR